jgi:predicted nucleic acid-binding protein
MYIIDTNVISELRKAKTGKADVNVIAWANTVKPASMFLSVITVLELETGILRKERVDAKQGQALRKWMYEQVLPAYKGRILPVDEDVAVQAAHLHVPDRQPEADALIAATALIKGFIVVTHNVADFEGMPVGVLNPWDPSTWGVISKRARP